MRNTQYVLAALGLTLLLGCNGIKVGDGIGGDGNGPGGEVNKQQLNDAQTAMCGNSGKKLLRDPWYISQNFSSLGYQSNSNRIYSITYTNTDCASGSVRSGSVDQPGETVTFNLSASSNCLPNRNLWTGDADPGANGTMIFRLVNYDGTAKVTLVVSQDFSLANGFNQFGFSVLTCQ